MSFCCTPIKPFNPMNPYVLDPRVMTICFPFFLSYLNLLKLKTKKKQMKPMKVLIVNRK